MSQATALALRTRMDAGEILRGEHAATIALGYVDAADQRMRQRTAHEGHILQAGKTNVGHELAATPHQPVVFLSRQACADALSGARPCGRKLALVAHGDTLPDRTAGLLMPPRPAAEWAPPPRGARPHAGRTPAATGDRR